MRNLFSEHSLEKESEILTNVGNNYEWIRGVKIFGQTFVTDGGTEKISKVGIHFLKSGSLAGDVEVVPMIMFVLNRYKFFMVEELELIKEVKGV